PGLSCQVYAVSVRDVTRKREPGDDSRTVLEGQPVWLFIADDIRLERIQGHKPRRHAVIRIFHPHASFSGKHGVLFQGCAQDGGPSPDILDMGTDQNERIELRGQHHRVVNRLGTPFLILQHQERYPEPASRLACHCIRHLLDKIRASAPDPAHAPVIQQWVRGVFAQWSDHLLFSQQACRGTRAMSATGDASRAEPAWTRLDPGPGYSSSNADLRASLISNNTASSVTTGFTCGGPG